MKTEFSRDGAYLAIMLYDEKDEPVMGSSVPYELGVGFALDTDDDGWRGRAYLQALFEYLVERNRGRLVQ